MSYNLARLVTWTAVGLTASIKKFCPSQNLKRGEFS